MYQIFCDNHVIYDPRSPKHIVQNPKCKLEVNTVGEASFRIFKNHPEYGQLQKLKSIFEIRQNGSPIFRGRMTDDSKDFYNSLSIDLEGVMAFFNDSLIRPFNYPEDFATDAAYIAASTNGNVVEFFLNWLIEQHNSQVQPFQQLKLGAVTVSDPNNYIARTSSEHMKTWEILKTRLFDSALGGYLCVRYEEDGNYIDYLSDFELTNTQRIMYGQNLLDITNESDASETYSAVLPLGKKLNEIDEDSEEDSRLTISGLPDGNISDDIVKEGDTIFSKSAVERFGFIYAPISETTFEDVTLAENLQEKAVEYLSGTAVKLLNTITVKAVDLNFSNEEIEAFRIYRYINVESKPHDLMDSYILSKMDIDILNPQNTVFTIGDTSLTLTDINASNRINATTKIENVTSQIKREATDLTEIQNTMLQLSTSIVNTCEEIILSSLRSYVEASNYDSFTETIQSQLQLLADQMNLQFSSMTDEIALVNGDLQEKFNLITKYFTFDINGLTIGQVDNPHKVVIDNDRFSMLVNDVEVLWIADGEVQTPDLTVTSSFNLFGYVISQDENMNVNCDYSGGVN